MPEVQNATRLRKRFVLDSRGSSNNSKWLTSLYTPDRALVHVEQGSIASKEHLSKQRRHLDSIATCKEAAVKSVGYRGLIGLLHKSEVNKDR